MYNLDKELNEKLNALQERMFQTTGYPRNQLSDESFYHVPIQTDTISSCMDAVANDREIVKFSHDTVNAMRGGVRRLSGVAYETK